VLSLIDLSKSFGSRRVLDRLHLEVVPGESVALLGANGSGKTTTLRCVVGLARPDAGRITIAGRDAAAIRLPPDRGSATCRNDRYSRRL
jgi:phosphonate transport system ATP-binding protein